MAIICAKKFIAQTIGLLGKLEGTETISSMAHQATLRSYAMIIGS